MRYSRLFGKTSKSIPSDASFVSHRFLLQGGFIKESVAGRYYMLPLGQRVQDKIINIIREEMNFAGAQEMLTPVLHPIDLWKETNRTNTAGFELMKIKDRRGAEFALGGTAEEMFVDLARKYTISYRDLPFNIYQFSLKFRDELRARGGLLRAREFIMKDAYSFHVDRKDFENEYENMRQTYEKIFRRIGIPKEKLYVVAADNGYIGGEYCHEFDVECEVGEGKFFVDESGYLAHEDVAEFQRKLDNEEMNAYSIVDQPAWVKTIEDNEKHYQKNASKFLKNVVYKNRVTGDIYIAVISGDLEVNKTKLEQKLKLVGLLEDASPEDLEKFGSKPGYVHSWGHKNVTYIVDLSVANGRNFIGGQKTETTDSINANYVRDFDHGLAVDIALAKNGYISPNGLPLIEKRGIEVGNIFQLGYHYSEKMSGAVFVDSDGVEKPYYMGCYGIGVGRTMATLIEIFHDDRGIVWPESVAPFKFHLIGLNGKGEEIYKKLLDSGAEVLFDDRENVSAGQKFADADLIGCPIRLVVSDKTAGKIELKKRNETESTLVEFEGLLEI